MISLSFSIVLAVGKPSNCDDTAYQAHPGYNGNEALWNGYMADSDGVCQTVYGTGTPSDVCKHAVQVSVAGNPYYLCWYDNEEVIVQTGFFNDLATAIQDFIQKIISAFQGFFGQIQTQIVTVQIGPYEGKYACEFFQLPWPGVNLKRVSCPVETPGAAINVADDEFCRTVMGSAFAVAEICDSNGVIVCSHPCETTPATIMPTQCAYDAARQRGSQAEPLSWCEGSDLVVVTNSSGKPEYCDDTAYQAHPGYNGNEALWDGYMADSDGVCQSQYGRGVPSPCVHSVQVSVAGNPYYLCWYNNS